MSGRVRTDPAHSPQVRKIAGGAPVASVAILSETEMGKVRNMVDPPQERANNEHLEEQSLRRDASKNREATWSNTVQASRLHKLQAKAEKLEEEERRRCVIDEQEKLLQQTKKQQTLDDANTKMYNRDARVVNLNKHMLLHQVSEEREQQVVLSARSREAAKLREIEEGQRIKIAAEDEKREKHEQALSARQKSKAEKDMHLQQLEELKKERKKEMEAQIREGLVLRQLAENDAENADKKRELARLRAREVATIQKQQLKEQGTPRKSPREKLDDRVLYDYDEEQQKANHYVVRKTQDAYIAQQNRMAKREQKNVKRDLALEQYMNSPRSRVEEAAEKMSSARSISDVCGEQDAERKMQTKRSKEQYNEYIHDTLAHSKHIKSNQRDVDANRQAIIARQVKAMEEEEALEAHMKREDAKRLQYFHRLQANEKQMTKAHEIDQDHKEKHLLQQMQQDEDKMFNNYIQANLPANMSSPAKNKALNAPNGNRMVIY